MDCQMPELNGYEATAAIRAQEGADRHTPIIALTAGRVAKTASAAWPRAWTAISPSRSTRTHCSPWWPGRSGPADGDPGPTASRIGHPSAAEFAIDHADFDELRLLAEATEHDFVTELIDQFVHETDLLLVDLRAASLRGDAVAVGHIAHSIMGSGGQLGGRRLALSCGRLESTAIAGDLSGGHVDLSEVESDYQELRVTLTERRSSAGSQQPGGLCA